MFRAAEPDRPAEPEAVARVLKSLRAPNESPEPDAPSEENEPR